MLGKTRGWVFDRTATNPENLEAPKRELPKGVGWLNTLGPVALALIAIQGVTGAFLAMYYSPHPDAAHETMRYIDHVLPMGRVVHGLHHYGDSAIVLAVFLHLLRVYFQGAYKPPRELVWITGVLLFGLVIGFGFTGALLPWDQKAYASTQVRTQFPAGIPFLGPMIQQLMRGGKDIGALTLTRFYAIHMLLLPMLLIPLVQVHLALAWRKGPTPPGARVGEEAAASGGRPVEQHLLRNAVAILIAFSIVLGLAVLRPVELEFKANPADATYSPRAEWYFLFLFQFLRDFASIPVLGKLPEWAIAGGIPAVVMGFLILAPWIDRGPERRPSKRPLMTGIMVVGLVAIVGLTVRAYSLLHPNATPGNSLYGHFTQGGEKGDIPPNLVKAGKAAFATSKPVPCATCHKAYADFSAGAGPEMSGYGLKTFLTDVPGHPELATMPFYDRFVKYVRGDIRQPNSKMPMYPVEVLSDEQLDAIAAYVSQDPAKVQIRHANPRRL